MPVQWMPVAGAAASSISRVTPTAVRPGRRITARASACQRPGALGREVYLAEPAGQEVQQRREKQQARPPGAARGEQPGDVPPAAVADGVVQRGADRPAGCLDVCTAVDERFGVVAACRPVQRCRRGPASVCASGSAQVAMSSATADRTSPHRDTTTPQRSHVSRHSLKGLTPALLAATRHAGGEMPRKPSVHARAEWLTQLAW
jgi:hypothetical protein